MLNKYSPSGKYSTTSFAYLFLVIVIIAPICAIYAIISLYNPSAYLGVLIAGFFSASVGMIIAFFVIKMGKVRNQKMAILFGLFGGLIAFYMQWAAWLGVALYYSNINAIVELENLKGAIFLLSHPLEMLKDMSMLYTEGSWHFEGSQMKGLPLLGIWIVEGLMILGFSIYFPLQEIKKPFSERGNEWFKEKQVLFNYITDKTEFITDLQTGASKLIEGMSKLNLASINSKNHSMLHIFYSQQGEYYLTIVNKRTHGKEKGFSNQILEKYIELDPTVASALMRR